LFSVTLVAQEVSRRQAYDLDVARCWRFVNATSIGEKLTAGRRADPSLLFGFYCSLLSYHFAAGCELSDLLAVCHEVAIFCYANLKMWRKAYRVILFNTYRLEPSNMFTFQRGCVVVSFSFTDIKQRMRALWKMDSSHPLQDYYHFWIFLYCYFSHDTCFRTRI